MSYRIALFDTEGDGLLDTVTRLWCASILELDAEDNIIAERTFSPKDIDELPQYLKQFHCFIGHNIIAYDLAVIAKLYGVRYDDVDIIDTLLMSRTQRPNRRAPKGTTAGPHSVEAWGVRLGYPKQVHDEWDRFSPEMMSRCVSDTRIQLALLKALKTEGEGEGWDRAHKLISKMFQYLQKQEEYGFYVDQDHMEWCLSTLNRWMSRIERVVVPHLPLVVEPKETKLAGIYGWVKKPFKKDGSYAEAVNRVYPELGKLSAGPDQDLLRLYGRSSLCEHTSASCSIGGPFSRVSFRPVDLDKALEVKGFLLSQGWEPAEWNTDANGQRTSPKLSKDDPFLGLDTKLGRLIARRVQCKQRRGTIEGWKSSIRSDGRISPKVAGLASTGRLRHQAIVNVPGSNAFFGGQMRAIFTAGPGRVLVGVDSASNQMRQLASHLKKMDGVGDEQFVHALLHGDSEDGTDLHSLNMRRSGVANRTLAKNFFYGCILFGAGDPKTAKILKTTRDAAGALKAEYFKEMPLLKQLIEQKQKQWRDSATKWWNPKWGKMEYRDGYITGLDGRPILVESEHAILAYLLQSDEAIQMAVAYVMAHKWMEKAGYVWGEDWGMVLWMHDEFQMECKPEIAEFARDTMCRAIAWAGDFLGIACPHAGKGVIGANWKETH